jgi:hypothetical protein
VSLCQLYIRLGTCADIVIEHDLIRRRARGFDPIVGRYIPRRERPEWKSKLYFSFKI